MLLIVVVALAVPGRFYSQTIMYGSRAPMQVDAVFAALGIACGLRASAPPTKLSFTGSPR